MKHYLNVCDINGAEVPPVDLITFGSPCQDMSVAGKRAGLKHTDNGDEETTRSGLFMEAVRIIREMREATHGRHPAFALWENVPGAFSSNGGDDFRLVLEELAKVKDKTAAIPKPVGGGWNTSGCVDGSNWSIAWRVMDAQYFGVPQRRRRIFLVADFAGHRAYEILFKPESLRRNFVAGGAKGKGTSAAAEKGTGADDSYAIENHHQDSRVRLSEDGIVQTLSGRMGTGGNNVPLTLKIRSGCEGGGKGPLIQTNLSATLATNNDQTVFQPKPYGICSFESNSMLSDNPQSGFYEADTSRTLDLNGGNPACNQGGVAIVAIEGNGSRPSHQGDGYKETDVSYTLNATEVHGVAYAWDGKDTTGTLTTKNAGGSEDA